MARETWDELNQRHNKEKTELHNRLYLEAARLRDQQEAERTAIGGVNDELAKKYELQLRQLSLEQGKEDKELTDRHIDEQNKFIEREKKVKEMLKSQQKMLEKNKEKER